jgi:hypothetical protein
MSQTILKIKNSKMSNALSAALKNDLKRWDLELQADRHQAKVNDELIRFGGKVVIIDMVNSSMCFIFSNFVAGEGAGKKKFEGRKVGIDFFRGQKGPPDDLRKEKDLYPGRFGLATEFAGDRNLINPWEWLVLTCVP